MIEIKITNTPKSLGLRARLLYIFLEKNHFFLRK